ncbi:MAG TPA: hypothetical protein EYH05_01690 [Anaerolineae bacterium]|nr:hypothetical protein [Anaerolineae bacterium]
MSEGVVDAGIFDKLAAWLIDNWELVQVTRSTCGRWLAVDYTGMGHQARIEYWDQAPVVIRRMGLAAVYRGQQDDQRRLR